METGTIFKFHNDLDTDQIIASQYLLLPNLDEMKGHAFFMTCDFAYLSKRIDFALITYIVSEDYRKESMYEYSVYRV